MAFKILNSLSRLSLLFSGLQILCVFPGGNQRGVFGLTLVQGEWKVYVSGLLDREQQDWYLLNITASDGLYVAHTAVEVTVMDANDNSPICNQVRDGEICRCATY